MVPANQPSSNRATTGAPAHAGYRASRTAAGGSSTAPRLARATFAPDPERAPASPLRLRLLPAPPLSPLFPESPDTFSLPPRVSEEAFFSLVSMETLEGWAAASVGVGVGTIEGSASEAGMASSTPAADSSGFVTLKKLNKVVFWTGSFGPIRCDFQKIVENPTQNIDFQLI